MFKEKVLQESCYSCCCWQENGNEGSKDRAPGMGTQAIQTPDWSSRFCEVTDTGLRDWVLQEFKDPLTHLLPWQLYKRQLIHGRIEANTETRKLKLELSDFLL